MRFGLAEGDLQTQEGRQRLFQVLVKHRPKHVWFSPKCGPWSGWSNLNGSKSVKSWDALQHSRIMHLDQIALGTVLLRYQREHDSHLHWEQLQNSRMFRLPYLQEVRQHLMVLGSRSVHSRGPDRSRHTAAHAQSPDNHDLIQKSVS